MCQKKPGPRCIKHAKKQLKRAYSKYKKIKNNTPASSFEDILKIQAAKEAHVFAVAMYYATPYMLKRINPTSKHPNYKEVQYLNRIIKKAAKAVNDFNNETPITVGNYVKIIKHGIVKHPKSTKMVVNNQNSRFIVWDKKNPYYLETVDDFGKIISIEKLDPSKRAYGFELQKKPDVHWVFWYTNQTRVG